MKLQYRKHGGPLDVSLSCAVESHNRQQITQEEAEDLEKLVVLSKFWTLPNSVSEGNHPEFFYMLSINAAAQAHSVRFSSGSFDDNPHIWRIVDLVESLCYRACAAEERPHQSASCCIER